MLEGKNIILRALSENDAQHTLELREDFEAIKQFMGNTYPVGLADEKNWINDLHRKGFRERIVFAIFQKKDDEKNFAGYLGVKNINYIHKTADFGIILAKEFRGKGLGKEAMEMFFDYLFRQINIRKIKLEVLEDNDIAINLYKRIGFKEEGRKVEEYWQDGKYKNVVLMYLIFDKLMRG